MELINVSGLQAGYTMGLQPDGRELLVVVVKGTFALPKDREEEPQPAEEQVPLVHTDVFTGEPGFSAPLYEMDYAPRKPRCDVLLNGSAYAPRGKPVERVTVSLSVGTLTKSFDVVGNRFWTRGMMLVTATNPEPFTVMPISYDNAFGGPDRSQEDQNQHRWYATNHVGAGYHEYLDAQFVDGKPLPNTEETGRRITDPMGKYKPMAFGPIGRAWQPRIKWAGTYDEKWLAEKFPFLPDDFDERYYQCAAEDQQTEYLKGGELVELTNLTPEGRATFRLPARLEVTVLFFLRTGEILESSAALDTFLLEPNRQRFVLGWRTAYPVRRSIREIQQIVVGRTARDWEEGQSRQRRLIGKRRFTSLREMVEAAQRSKNL
jgi:hypothetical protein